MWDSAKWSGEPLEKRLDLFGDITGIACIVVASAFFFWLQTQTAVPGIAAIYSVAIVAYGACSWVLFHAGGEVIRLLKRLNNLPYQGKISELTVEHAEEGEVLLCSACGSELAQDSGSCPKCGAKLEQ